MGKRWSLSLLVISIISLGFLRGYLFGNINWIYKTLTVNRPNAARPEFYFLLEWSPDAILSLKWILTGIFFFLFAGLTYLIVKVAFDNAGYNRIVGLMYLGLLSIAFVLYALGFLTGYSEDFYHLVRTVMGIAQSFMPLMILVIIIKFLPQNTSE